MTMTTTVPKTKVLVASRYKWVRATTHREPVVKVDEHGNKRVVWDDFVRQFIVVGRNDHGLSYMTAEEADFLVNSDENKAAASGPDGQADYWFPNGMPVPVKLDFQSDIFGPFIPPVKATEGAGGDPRAQAANDKRRLEEMKVIADYEAREAEGQDSSYTRDMVKAGTGEPRVITAADAEAAGFVTEE